MKISFDFDGVLSRPDIQDLCLKFVGLHASVYITTSRPKEWGHDLSAGGNSELYQVADRLGIPRMNIQFTEYADKSEFLDGFDLHFDDDTVIIKEIEQSPISCIPVLVTSSPILYKP